MPFQGARAGPQRESEDESLSSGPEVREAKRPEVFIVDQEFIEQRGHQERGIRPPCSRGCVPELLKGALGGRRLSWTHTDEVRAADREWAGRQTGSSPRSGVGLLQADAAGQGIRASPARTPDLGNGRGWADGRESRQHSGHPLAENEVERIDHLGGITGASPSASKCFRWSISSSLRVPNSKKPDETPTRTTSCAKKQDIRMGALRQD